MNDHQIIGMFKALCDENRIRIIKLLQNGEKCACRLLDEMKISQPTLSHHMKILCDSGLVVCRKEGKWMHYSLSAQGARAAVAILTKLLAADEAVQYSKDREENT